MDSEFRMYEYIRKVLRDLGWDSKNPSKGGDVYTQKEFYKHDKTLTESLGQRAPENTVRIPWDGGFRYWMVEAKRSHSELTEAVKEAKEYADDVNAHAKMPVAPFATGIAGSPDDSFLVSTWYWNGVKWSEVSINDHVTTGFLSPDQCKDILAKNSHKIALFDDDPDRFLKKANAINETLHDNGVTASNRAKVMGALLLALAEDGNMRIYSSATRMIREVNSNIEAILTKQGKEDFAGTISLRLPATPKNHKAFRRAIVDTLAHLRAMNVRSAISSGDDALGKFYETFLKYANDAKDMGIVLTPRHITKMAVEILNIGPDHRVFDPTCGTGGFLVSAMDHVRNTKGLSAQFKKQGVWGVESEDPVYGLALVNMIFRGDGKSGLQDGNCFDHQFWYKNGKVECTLPGDQAPKGAGRPFTHVLMNPPFKVKRDVPKFVDYALAQCQPGAFLFAVLPHIIVGGDNFSKWRMETLKRHTLRAIVKFVPKLFYPVMERTYGLIIEAHRPHKKDDDVFMSFLFDDDSRPRLSKMLSMHSAIDNVEETTRDLRSFLLGVSVGHKNIPRERIITKLRLTPDGDFYPKGLYEPQTYIENEKPRLHPNVKARAAGLFSAIALNKKGTPSPIGNSIKCFPLSKFYQREIATPMSSLKNYADGDTPVVSATAYNNGIAAWKQIPENEIVSNLMSISKTHEGEKACQAFWHPYRFSAINTVYLLEVVPEFSRDNDLMLYLCQQISDSNLWRFDYARTVKLDEVEVYLPVKSDGSFDFQAMRDAVQNILKD